VWAQTPGPSPGGPSGLGRGGMVLREFGLAGPHWKVVTGAPYSADVSNALVQMLADGNTIHRTTTGKIARDSQGRTYLQETVTEGPLARNGPTTLTFVTDPVAGYSYELNANTKTATRRPYRTPRANGKRPPDAERRPGHEA